MASTTSASVNGADEEGGAGSSSGNGGGQLRVAGKNLPQLNTTLQGDSSDLLHQQQPLSPTYGTFIGGSTRQQVLSPSSKGSVGGLCSGFFTQVMAVLIAVYITLVDNVPYGLLVFPAQLNLSMLGIQMVVFSAFVSQVVYCFASSFPSALGSNIIENVVFLATISSSVAQQLQSEGRPDMILPTTLLIFVLSSVLTGLAFYTLGMLQLGKISSFVPKHVLLGCIGGMGMFIATQGIGISTGLPWDFSPQQMLRQVEPPALAKSGLTLLLTLGLTAVRTLIKHPVVTPIYFFLVPAAFFLTLHLAGVSRQQAAADGWLFSFEPQHEDQGGASASSSLLIDPQCLAFPGVLHCLSLRRVAWGLALDFLLPMAGIVFFSVIHVPVNVPALSSTTGIEADLNRELMAHGLSNLLSGVTCGLQNYMAYSTSALYYKTGGHGKLSSLTVAALLLGFLAMGPQAASYFPRPLAGCLLLHLGTVLLWESLVEPWERAVDQFEYGVIVTIAACMTFVGFLQGLGIGVLLACCTFVVQGSLVNPIAQAFLGDGLRSREMRSSEERKMLDLRMQGLVYVIRLRGSLFFGNAEQLWIHVREVLTRMTDGFGAGPLQFLILDMEDVVAIDYHGRERLARTCKLVSDHRVLMVWAQLSEPLKKALRHANCFKAASSRAHPHLRLHHFSRDLNAAFAYVEAAVLKANPPALPRHPLDQQQQQQQHNDSSFLLRTLYKLTAETGSLHNRQMKEEVEHAALLRRLEAYFTRQAVPAGTTLWRRNDPPNMALLLESGLLGVPRESNDPSVKASMAQLPASVRTPVPLPPWLPMAYTAVASSPHDPHAEGDSADPHTQLLEVSRPGQMSGELGLFTRELRKYTLVAVEDSVVWRLDSQALKRLLAQDPLGYTVLQRLALKYASHRLHSLMLMGQLHSV